uniref:ISXO2-like transposase domain-containing protein n=1 Tax=Octopus bimaculoides TaxID=37653 RepID=A0A0L8G738_OCTBM
MYDFTARNRFQNFDTFLKHIAERRWAFGGWDRENKIGFLVFVNNRSSETLLPLIRKFIKPGTTVHSDYCSEYNGIDVEPRYSHFKVNHRENFVGPVTNVHTNSVECCKKNAKSRFKTMMGVHTNMIESHLAEFLWRGKYGKTSDECLRNILKHLSKWFTFE